MAHPPDSTCTAHQPGGATSSVRPCPNLWPLSVKFDSGWLCCVRPQFTHEASPSIAWSCRGQAWQREAARPVVARPPSVRNSPSGVCGGAAVGRIYVLGRQNDPFQSSAQPKSRIATGAQRAPEWYLAVRPSTRDEPSPTARRSCRISKGYTLPQRFFDVIHRAI